MVPQQFFSDCRSVLLGESHEGHAAECGLRRRVRGQQQLPAERVGALPGGAVADVVHPVEEEAEGAERARCDPAAERRQVDPASGWSVARAEIGFVGRRSATSAA